jgi:glycosyltransferase involved in cell wall biosynthesis
MNRSIAFVLSGSAEKPVGGFKVVYEYANRLARKGWTVRVIHPFDLRPTKQPLVKKIIHLARFMKCLILKTYLPTSWFKIDPGVRMLWVPSLSEFFIPRSEFIVACPVQSASFVNSYPTNRGKKFYFIQHFEDWEMPKDEAIRTWKFPLRKIVIAKWLAEIAQGLGEESVYIPNGLDFSFFKNLKPFGSRPLKSIMFMSHAHAFKGTCYALEALKILKRKYPDIVARTFSLYPKAENFPDFIEYFLGPSQDKLRDLYNASAIFLSPSLAEGWPLPPAEAMMCGCVVVATDIGGHREYIEDGTNGLFCKPRSADSIVEAIEKVFCNPNLASKISEAAPASLQRFDWDSRVELFEQALLSK